MRLAPFCLALLLLLPVAAFSQEAANKAKTAVIDAAQADADFSWQGEYAGWRWDAARGSIYSGLQVVALGDGKFDAALLDGGLPGNGWNLSGREKLSGRLEGSVLDLVGQDHRIRITPSSAAVLDSSGRNVGRLEKAKRISRTMGAAPPPGAVVLFGGTGVAWDQPAEGRRRPTSQREPSAGGPALADASLSHPTLSGAKLAPDGSLLAGMLTKMPVAGFQMHLEFRTPYMPAARGQGRGNSGVYIQQRYEVQILDSFGLEGLDNECGGLYKQTRPDVNMCLPPLSWQTYDIWFTPARFAADGKTKLANAVITVLHNGVPVHWQREVTAKTGGGKPEGPEPLPINLQDHGNPVTFRNLWLVPIQPAATIASACDGTVAWSARRPVRHRVAMRRGW